MNCFGCTNAKCVIREFDEHPSFIFTDPASMFNEIRSVPNWGD